jgi:hypothetical protein
METKSDHSDTIARVCQELLKGDHNEAAEIARNEYPFNPTLPDKRSYTEYQSTKIFIRDGFVDRYSGDRLVFPGVLRLLSVKLPNEFPRHPNWKMSESHIVYWELFPTVDHIIPVARGGKDEESNWVTTSMLGNSAKSNWTLEELKWTLMPPGDYKQWDGMLNWFLKYIGKNSDILENPYIKRWHRAAVRAISKLP